MIADRIRGGRQPFRLALSGGTTPRGCYRRLAHLHQVPWDCVEIYLGDERFVPHDHPDSNYRMVRETLLAGRHGRHRAACSPCPPMARRKARPTRYEEILRQQYGASRLRAGLPLFDLQLLGLGEDGHTASLLAGPAGAGRTRALGRGGAGRPRSSRASR